MNQPSIAPQNSNRPPPIILAYPRVYQNLFSPQWKHDFDNVIAKCRALTAQRPAPGDRHDGFFGLGGLGDNKALHLLTVWAAALGEPDIFIIGGRGDGFGPGYTCPTQEELRAGIYGDLTPVNLL